MSVASWFGKMRQSADARRNLGEGGRRRAGELGGDRTGISFYFVCEVGMVVVAAFAGDVKEPSPGGSLADFVQGIAIPADVDKFFRADVEVKAEKPFELAGGDEASPGQFLDRYPAFCQIDRLGQGQCLLRGVAEAVIEEAVEQQGKAAGRGPRYCRRRPGSNCIVPSAVFFRRTWS